MSGELSATNPGQPPPDIYVRSRGYYLKFAVHWLANRALQPLEAWLLPRGEDLSYAPIFVVGCPRSGTTLCVQLLVAGFRLSYPTNVFRYLPQAPWLGTMLLGPVLRSSPSRFSSRFGRIAGLGSPAEVGEFLHRWFRRWPTYTEPSPEQIERLKGLRRYLSVLSRHAGAPVILKNTYNTLRIGPLAAAIPEALFLSVERNVADTALSLLRARRALRGSHDKWLGVDPPEFEELRKYSPHEQVVLQVLSITKHVRRDLGRYVPSQRVFQICYEAMCDDPRSFLDRFAAFVHSNAGELQINETVPHRFPRRTGKDHDGEDRRLIEDAVLRFADDEQPSPASEQPEMAPAA